MIPLYKHQNTTFSFNSMFTSDRKGNINMEVNSNPGVVFQAENDYDDDVFYAEIRRQILLLTTEENEDLHERKRLNSAGVTNGARKRSVYGFSGGSPPGRRLCLWESDKFGTSAPVWLVNLWKNGKGTGVFIPQVVQCSGKQIPGTGRLNHSRRKMYRPVGNKH